MRYLQVTLLLLFCSQASAQATDLIISEYVEGSGSNKYLELYNGTTASINLANYELRLYANGASTPTTTVTLSGTLASGSTIVYKGSGASAYSGAATLNNALAYNGDDAIALYKTTTSSFVDIVGNIGCDPGSSWTSGSFSTLDKTLVRNPSVCSGVTTDPSNSSCPFPTLATEWTQYNTDVVSNLGSHTMSCVVCTPAAAPTVPTSGFSATTFCTSAQLSFTNGNGVNRIVVVSATNFSNTPSNSTAYTANSTFGSGSIVGAGNYVVMNGTGSSVTVTGLTYNTTYYVKIFEYNGTTANCTESYLTSGISSFTFSTQVNCGTPQIRSVLADACSTQEGLDELVIVENGANALPISDITINFPSGGSYCNSGCGTNTLQNNAAYITQLNTQAGCALFQYADPIPAGGIIVVFTGLTPSYVFDYSTQCPSTSVYYAVFCNNSSTAGRFANSGTGTRTLDMVFGSNTDQVTYNLASTLGDGTFVDFDTPGNATYRQEINCIYPLGVEWGYFTGTAHKKETYLEWETLSEKNTDYFTIERSNGIDGFQPIGYHPCAGNSERAIQYAFSDVHPLVGTNYYRLRQTDIDGQYIYSNTIAVNHYNSDFTVSYAEATEQLCFSYPLPEESVICVMTTDGKTLLNTILTEKVSSTQVSLPKGIVIVHITERNGRVHSQKLVVQ